MERAHVDVAIGDLPFLVYPSEDHPYERSTGRWRKDQFDAERHPGEQSLAGWWLRSQTDFSGGAGITYYEPLLGEGSENRFIDSEGVDVFSEDSVRLLRRMEVVEGGAGDNLEMVGLGLFRNLYRDGGDFFILDDAGSNPVTPLGGNPRGITRIPDNSWLVGHDEGISRVRDSGATSHVIQGASAPLRPYWVKDRIFATQNHKILQLTLQTGDITSDENDYIVHQDPSPAWRWVGVAQTPGAVWAAGGAHSRSHIVAFAVDGQGELPEISGAPVRIEMPWGEAITTLESYSDFLLIGTTAGFRIAVTDGDTAQLGPLIWDDEEVHSITARWDFAWVGVSGGRVRKVNLGVPTSDGLRFAWAHDAQLPDAGDVQGIGWVYGRLAMAAANAGAARQHDTELVESGYIDTGFARWGTLEKKRVSSAMIIGDSSNGSIAIGAATAKDAYTPITTLGTWAGSREVDLTLPGGSPAVEKLSLRLTLRRDPQDSSQGPQLEGYQLRAMPAPAKKQRLISVPLKLFDKETNRMGVDMGGDDYAWIRLRELERLEDSNEPVIFQDFRTGESRTVIVENIEFYNLSAPSREQTGFGGWIQAVLRTID